MTKTTTKPEQISLLEPETGKKPKRPKKTQPSLTTAQQLGSIIKSAGDIMRKDKGLNGDLDRLPMLTWIMFLKFPDDLEQIRETDAVLKGGKFRPAIEAPYRWRDWAAQADGISGDELIAFVNNDEAVRPDTTRGPGLFAYLRSLQGAEGSDRRDVTRELEILVKSNAGNRLHAISQKGVKPLSELVSVRGGGTPSKANPLYWHGTIPWVSPKDMKDRELFDACDHISEDAVANSSAKLIDSGAVLIVVRGMILAHTVPSAILRMSAAINQDMKALLPNENLSSEYLCTTLWALNQELLGLIEKSTHDTRKLETDTLLSFRIPVPDVSEQKQIVDELERFQSKAIALKRLQAETAAELDALLPAILNKAFKGEL
jgi:Type I restriction modification DNA specificity domain